MYTVTHDPIEVNAGEAVSITFTVVDQAAVAVSVATATASYKIARKKGDTAILTKTQAAGITLASNTAVVAFDTASLVNADADQLYGEFIGQLTITKDGFDLVVAEGTISVAPVVI